nr:hypothetical protein [Tanacetum cinerariifolium]
DVAQVANAARNYAEPGYETVGSKRHTRWGTHVPIPTSPTPVRTALRPCLPQIRGEIREEFRPGSGPSNAGGNPTPMVNTRTDTDLSTAVQNALQATLPRIHEEIREEFRTGSGSSNASGNPTPVTI